ncbi:MAG: BamA/TamA family outer membrane protein, partial [Bacteroidales bacterium]|nr:BamA/TamA family outer membrane protein [Bacteroidales bacterium]
EKFVKNKFSEDKLSLISFYNDNGFKDFEIISDSLYTISDDRVGLHIKVDEGNQYHIRNISWVGNSIYTSEYLQTVFDVEKGSVYNRSLIYDRLRGESGAQDAVDNLYLNNGYLFSSITPIETKVENDSIDLEIRIYEGEQAYINDIIITGNEKTNEHVARRELYTLPGDLFNKESIIRSVRQLGVLGHWDAEKINPTPISNQVSGSIDLQYALEEKANDQFEISGGWGAGMIIGTVGVSFNNFSMKNFFKLKEWRPYPSGDGQTFSIRAQSNGRVYQSYSISFNEPWLGGKKTNSLSVSLYKSVLTTGTRRGEDGYTSMNIYGASIGLGKRLSWPDDFFTIYGQIGYQKYDMNNYSSYFVFENGISNLFSFTAQIQRYSVSPSVLYPRSGSSYTLSLQITPPYSLLNNKDYSTMTDQEKFRWIEFHKWTFKAENYFPITKNDKMVLASKFSFGYLGHYNNDIGPSPFENYSVGGDGMTGYTFYGQDIIKLRGYDTGAVTPHEYTSSGSYVARGNVYSKVT